MASSLKASKTGLETIDKARRSKGWNKAEEVWFEKAGVSRSSLMRFWRGDAILRERFIAICETVGCNWEEIVDNTISSTNSPDIEVYISEWQELCQTMLEGRESLTTNQFTARDEIRFKVNKDIFPVGLVKRSRQRLFDMLDKDFRPKPENGSELYKPEGERVKYNDCMKLLKDVNSEKPQRIAIVGYPGDGKTTWLQKIAFWVLENTDNLLIWISLGDLKGKTIEEYLLEDWLKAACKKRIVEEKIQNNFVEQFNNGRVWLLLDGVDEIAAQPVDALATVAREITGWIGGAGVALTCRINVWDDSKNALEDFETYQILGFESNQIDKLIDRWFKNTDIEVGKQLREKLTPSPENQDKLNPKWRRLKDAIKNPLRLTILFYICRRNGSLPELDAEFYRQFIEIFYQWKKERFSEIQDKRQELENALKKLALEGVKQNQFILPHSLVENTINDKSLFQLSLQLGLLNQVGIIEKSLNEKIYSFWHPAFQEYFAALEIDSNKDYDFDIILQGFASQWSEVFLFWKDIKNLPKDEVDQYIDELIGSLIRKLKNEDCQLIAEGLENILYDLDKLQLQGFAWRLKTKIERQGITEKNKNTIIYLLKKIYEYTNDLHICLLVTMSLEKLGDEGAINTFISFCEKNNEFKQFLEKVVTKLKNSTENYIIRDYIKDLFIRDDFI